MALRAPRTSDRAIDWGGGGYRGGSIIATVKQEQGDLEALWRAIYARNVPQKIRRDVSPLPVGMGDLPVLKPSDVVLKLPQKDVVYPTITRAPLPPEIDRRDTPPNQEVVPGMKPFYANPGSLDYFEIDKLREAGYQVLDPSGGPYVRTKPAVVAPPIVAPPKSSTTNGGSMDLGNLIGDIATTYIQTRYAQPPAVAAQPAYSAFDAGSDIIDFFTDPATGTVIPVKKKKPCRRRRKRLATKSDLGDLAALKAILGNGEAFKAWIATHSR